MAAHKNPKHQRDAHLARINALKHKIELLKRQYVRLEAEMKELKRYEYKSRGIVSALKRILGSPKRNLDADAWRRCLVKRAEIRNLMERTRRSIEASQTEMEKLLVTLSPREIQWLTL
jgi:predicted RNase H-like nuclease (RuvC/YqgF family)